MKNKDFTAFILSHGRANNVITYDTLKKCGYTGKIILIIDDEDEQQDEYIKNFGKEYIYIFHKDNVKFDLMTNEKKDKRAIVWARNVCFKAARDLGVKYFIELDDDYTEFSFTYSPKGEFKQKHLTNLDKVFDVFLDFYIKNKRIKSIAFCQRGDFIGGKGNGIITKHQWKRKAMNSFICATDREFEFKGKINEDVNTYVGLGNKGELFFSVPDVALNQVQTQQNEGGMSDIYLLKGTYYKSFYSVMILPSAVKISTMGYIEKRIHHKINWNNTVPKILKEEVKTLQT